VVTLVFYRKRAFESGDGRTLWRAFDKTVRRKPLAGAVDVVQGGCSLGLTLEIMVRAIHTGEVGRGCAGIKTGRSCAGGRTTAIRCFRVCPSRNSMAMNASPS
jgi:hypothetical protein